MIKIKCKDRKKIEEWYIKELVPIISQKRDINAKKLSYSTEPMIQNLASLNDCMLSDLLIAPMDELIQKYEWINEYVKLVNLISNYKLFKENLKEKGIRSKYAASREDYLNKYKGKYVSDLLVSDTIKHISESQKRFEAFIHRAKTKLTELNHSVELIFSYEFMPEQVRRELVARLNITVCPYCNQQYIQAFYDHKGYRYLGDLDHFIPKSCMPLFSLSIRNFVPCCKSCNQMFKKNNPRPILNPWIDGFDDDINLNLYYRDVDAIIGANANMEMRWEPSPRAKKKKQEKIALAENNVKLFRLNETYEYHKCDIQLALKRRYRTNRVYRKCVKDILNKSGDRSCLFSNAKEIYGVSMDSELFQHEPLSKAIYDAVIKN